MPWTCVPCETEVADTQACPACGAIKTSWTVVAARTRTLAIERKRFTVEVGTDATPRAPSAAAPAAWVEATKVRSLPKAEARALAGRGLLPAAAHTLFVGLRGPGAAKGEVTLELLFTTRPSQEVVLPGPGEGGASHVRVLFVHGEGACDDLRFEGLHVVDATDVTGPAPTVEVSALGRPAQPVALTPYARSFLFSA